MVLRLAPTRRVRGCGDGFELVAWQLRDGHPLECSLSGERFTARQEAEKALQQHPETLPLQWLEWHATAAEFASYSTGLQHLCCMFRRGAAVHFTSCFSELEKTLAARLSVILHPSALSTAGSVSAELLLEAAHALGTCWNPSRSLPSISATISNQACSFLPALVLQYQLAGDSLPSSLLQESVAVRRSLLAGILDTAGLRADSAVIELRLLDQRWLDDVSILARSLGCTVTLHCNGIDISGHEVHHLPFKRLPRATVPKCAQDALFPHDNVHFKLRRVEHASYYGFEVAASPLSVHPGRLLMDDFVVTHNTLCLLCSALAWSSTNLARSVAISSERCQFAFYSWYRYHLCACLLFSAETRSSLPDAPGTAPSYSQVSQEHYNTGMAHSGNRLTASLCIILLLSLLRPLVSRPQLVSVP
jgi:hypothetical protein